MRASRHVCIDPGDTYRWDYRLHRRARWSATGRTTIAIDGSAQPRLQGVTVGSVDDLQAMCDAIDINEMRPVIDKMFPFDQVAEAFRHMASGVHFGKVAIAVGL